MENSISIKNLKKSYNSTDVFSDLNLELEKGKIIAFFGPNGCGKSTFLNILSGIVDKDGGALNNFDKSSFSYMFQNYQSSLMPWRNNFDNLSLPLEFKSIKRDLIESRIKETYNKYGFKIDLKSYPYELSGGQKQFLAFLRAIITNPTTLLLDEPFSALDYENSFLLSNKLQEYYLNNKPTVLVITHDIEEAIYLADEIIIFSKKPTKIIGRIKNPLPRPRNLETLKSEQFHKIKKEVLKIFQSETGL